MVEKTKMVEKTWTFEAGDRVPDWLMRQINCVLFFCRDAVVLESRGEFQLFPTTPIQMTDTLILAEIIDQKIDSEVEHVQPITTHILPRRQSLN
jgi:hypothetical protein